MSKTKVLGMEYGIEITRPWSTEMYDHNDKVSDNMKQAIRAALNNAYEECDDEDVRAIARAVCAYGHGYGYDIQGMYDDACKELEMVPNHWLNEFCWPELVDGEYVKDLDVKFVGFKK